MAQNNQRKYIHTYIQEVQIILSLARSRGSPVINGLDCIYNYKFSGLQMTWFRTKKKNSCEHK